MSTKPKIAKILSPVLFPFLISLAEKLPLGAIFQLAILAVATMLASKIKIAQYKIDMTIFLCLSFLGLYILMGHRIVRLYPFCISASIFLSFYHSYRQDKMLLVRQVSLFKKNISEAEVQMLKSILNIWVLATGFNSSILFLMLFTFSTTTWMYYAGFISYLFLLSVVFLSIIMGQYILYRSKIQGTNIS